MELQVEAETSAGQICMCGILEIIQTGPGPPPIHQWPPYPTQIQIQIPRYLVRPETSVETPHRARPRPLHQAQKLILHDNQLQMRTPNQNPYPALQNTGVK